MSWTSTGRGRKSREEGGTSIYIRERHGIYIVRRQGGERDAFRTRALPAHPGERLSASIQPIDKMDLDRLGRFSHLPDLGYLTRQAPDTPAKA